MLCIVKFTCKYTCNAFIVLLLIVVLHCLLFTVNKHLKENNDIFSSIDDHRMVNQRLNWRLTRSSSHGIDINELKTCASEAWCKMIIMPKLTLKYLYCLYMNLSFINHSILSEYEIYFAMYMYSCHVHIRVEF